MPNPLATGQALTHRSLPEPPSSQSGGADHVRNSLVWMTVLVLSLLLLPRPPRTAFPQSSCNFCANGHAVCARLGGMEGALKLVRERSAGHIKDERVRTLATWALAVREPYSQSVRQPPPMSPRDAVELLGSVLHAIYKNVFASIFVGAGPLPDAFPQPVRAASMYSSAAMASMNRMMQIFLMPRSKRASPRRIREVWARLPTPFDPSSVVLPPDLWWSTPNAAIADALRFMVVEQERIEARWLPPSVAAAVTRFIAYEYRGRPMVYIDGEWATAAGMPTVEGNDNVFLVSFLLTAALDSSAVRGELIDEFRRRFEHLDEVVELMLREVISWAAWVASRRMVAWMGAYASPGGQQYA